MTMTIRSRTVRRILRLEGQADRQATREARATTRATTLRRRADTLRGEARALEASLSGSQRGELARARAGPAPRRQSSHNSGDGLARATARAVAHGRPDGRKPGRHLPGSPPEAV